MSASAWIMLGVTWTIIIVFTARSFWKVITLPAAPARDGADELEDGVEPR